MFLIRNKNELISANSMDHFVFATRNRQTETDRDIYFATKVQLQIINLHNQQMKIK